jgi:phosphoribosylformylglycinamidine synthase subunit PurQ / glutaminase
MKAPHALVLSAPGTNRDRDVADALELVGATVERVPMHLLRESAERLKGTQMVILAGGFSHADALGSGAVWAHDIRTHFSDELRAFVNDGKVVLGICNGFQTLVRTGFLPGSLAANAQGAFTCRWVTLAPTSNQSIWTNGLDQPFDCPVAHGEGRYVADDATVVRHGALTYSSDTNPNGSTHDIAGVTDTTGRILGLMPHPENHIRAYQHPHSHRLTPNDSKAAGHPRQLGLALFEAGVRHARRI